MSLWSRISNVFRAGRLRRDIDEELETHLAEAIEAGRDPAEAKRALGSVLQRREESRDIRLIPWLDSLRADAVFGWRQLAKNRVSSAAAVLSLALAIGACTSAFRLIDALLLRPLPVTQPEQLYSVFRQGIGPDGKPASGDAWAHPAFREMRDVVKSEAELIAVSNADRVDLTYKSDQEMEKAYLQYVSGWMFGSFGLRPAVGRLLTRNDDLKPASHPVAVLSFDYWTSRFGRDPGVVGRTFRMGDTLYEIVGVVQAPFTGTEPGTVTDLFVPTMMHPGAARSDWTWHRALARVKPGAAIEPVRAKLHATSRAFEEERAKSFTGMTRETIERFLDQTVMLEPAAAGVSNLQQRFRRPLMALGVLVALVLLIACANVANLMTAQAAARAREMALRISIGAGRWRLVQLVLVESTWLGFFAAAIGALFAWWSAPFVVSRINPPDNPARLSLPMDFTVLGFAIVLTAAVTCLFGLVPALRTSSVKPASTLKGGADPHSRRRLMHALIAVQVAFCFVVVFIAGLFVATYDRLANQPTGFSAGRVLTVDTVAQRAQSPETWNQLAQHLRAVPGVETVAISGWPLLGGGDWNGFVSVNGAPPGPVLAHFLSVSPGWIDAMKIPFLDGRDFRRTDTSPGAAIINEAFVSQFLNGENPIGQSFAKGSDRYQVIGVVRNAPYRNMRDPIVPVAYVPILRTGGDGGFEALRQATLIVRSAGTNPLALASLLRHQVPRAHPGFRVSRIRPQAELVQAQTIRERILAMLALFFAVVALLLAAVGLYGVLNYSVVERRREIGIRMALGARAASIARRVTADVFSMVVVGALTGLALGLGSVRYVESVLYEVRATEVAVLALPSFSILLAALLAAVPAVLRAVRVDPAMTLRAE
jgi:predicted permease